MPHIYWLTLISFIVILLCIYIYIYYSLLPNVIYRPVSVTNPVLAVILGFYIQLVQHFLFIFSVRRFFSKPLLCFLVVFLFVAIFHQSSYFSSLFSGFLISCTQNNAYPFFFCRTLPFVVSFLYIRLSSNRIFFSRRLPSVVYFLLYLLCLSSFYLI